MSRAIVVVCAFAIVMCASAKPEFLRILNQRYAPPSSSALGLAGCRACHTAPPSRNDYGRAVNDLMKAQNAGSPTAEMLGELESQDSDGDGVSNGDELRAGSLPGDSASVPATGTPPANPVTEPTAPSARGDDGAAPTEPVIPLHSGHPMLVHFPIALFLFGVFLEVLGVQRKSEAMRQAAYYNLLAGALFTLIVIPAGVAWWLRAGFSLQGLLLAHLILGVSAAASMGVALAVRRQSPDPTVLYWVCLGLAGLLVGATGHFGGLMVHGA